MIAIRMLIRRGVPLLTPGHSVGPAPSPRVEAPQYSVWALNELLYHGASPSRAADAFLAHAGEDEARRAVLRKLGLEPLPFTSRQPQECNSCGQSLSVARVCCSSASYDDACCGPHTPDVPECTYYPQR
jgi:hypothetical protein